MEYTVLETSDALCQEISCTWELIPFWGEKYCIFFSEGHTKQREGAHAAILHHAEI